MSEILSQEQIDSLLGQQAMGGDLAADDTAGGGDIGAERDYTVLSSAFELFNEQASTVISTVLNKDISFTVDRCDKADKESVASGAETGLLIVQVPFKSGFSGTLYCIMPKKDVAMLSDLMMMGDGTAEYTDDHRDAIAELLSQVMGSYTTALGDKIGTSVGTNTLSAAEFDAANLPFDVENSDMAILSLTVGGANTSRLVFVIPNDLSSELVAKLKATQQNDIDDSTGGIGLNSSELNDLSQVTGSSDDSLGFTETPISAMSHSRINAPKENIDMLLDIELDVSIELGRTNMSIKRVLEMGPGSIVELDRMAGEPVDLLVNNKVVAKGEVVVVDENFGIRIVSLVSPEERIKSLK